MFAGPRLEIKYFQNIYIYIDIHRPSQNNDFNWCSLCVFFFLHSITFRIDPLLSISFLNFRWQTIESSWMKVNETFFFLEIIWTESIGMIAQIIVGYFLEISCEYGLVILNITRNHCTTSLKRVYLLKKKKCPSITFGLVLKALIRGSSLDYSKTDNDHHRTI